MTPLRIGDRVLVLKPPAGMLHWVGELGTVTFVDALDQYIVTMDDSRLWFRCAGGDVELWNGAEERPEPVYLERQSDA